MSKSPKTMYRIYRSNSVKAKQNKKVLTLNLIQIKYKNYCIFKEAKQKVETLKTKE